MAINLLFYFTFRNLPLPWPKIHNVTIEYQVPLKRSPGFECEHVQDSTAERIQILLLHVCVSLTSDVYAAFWPFHK